MKNERRNTKAKTSNQNTEPVWSASGRACQKHPLDEYQHGLWAGQANQSVPQRKKRRDTADTRHPRHSPARDVLGAKGKADEIEKVIGISFSPSGDGKFVTNNKAWTRDEPARTLWTVVWFFDKWKAWCHGTVNLHEHFPGHRVLVPANPRAMWRTPARAPRVN